MPKKIKNKIKKEKKKKKRVNKFRCVFVIGVQPENRKIILLRTSKVNSVSHTIWWFSKEFKQIIKERHGPLICIVSLLTSPWTLLSSIEMIECGDWKIKTFVCECDQPINQNIKCIYYIQYTSYTKQIKREAEKRPNMNKLFNKKLICEKIS
jgi:hypothetical protein